MTPLRRRMINQMALRGFSLQTRKAYLFQVSSVAQYYHRSPDQLTTDELQCYVLYLMQQRHWSFSSCRQFIHAIRFLFAQVLKRPLDRVELPHPRKVQKLPDLLYPDEVKTLIAHCDNLKHQTGLVLAYATGMRISEVLALQVDDLDGAHDQIKVRQGKGCKDRYVIFTEGLKRQLRCYWRQYRPEQYVLYGIRKQFPLSASSLRRALKAAAVCSGIQKQVRFHSLRHAYATHQLLAGMPLNRLQQLLGHRQIATTLRYTHWVASMSGARLVTEDLLNDWRIKR